MRVRSRSSIGRSFTPLPTNILSPLLDKDSWILPLHFCQIAAHPILHWSNSGSPSLNVLHRMHLMKKMLSEDELRIEKSY
jgi:hypothetical protein